MINKLKKNNKAVIFTLLALILSAMFILILTAGRSNRIDNKIELSKTRSSLFMDYHESFYAYANYALEVSAKACFRSIGEYLIYEGVFYDTEQDFLDDVIECMNSSNSTEFNVHLLPSENLTIPVLLDQFINLTEEDYGINTKYTITDINFSGISPDRLTINADIISTINDSYITLNLPKSELMTDFNLIGTIDPYYTTNLNVNYENPKIITRVSAIGVNMEDLKELDFEDFISKVDYLEYSPIGIPFTSRFFNGSSTSSDGLIQIINNSNVIDEGVRNQSSWIDVHVINGTIFNCQDLRCKSGACDINDFAIDFTLFVALRDRYNLSTTGWHAKCN